ncbi:hypothetical protein CYV15_00715 [Riemerella anatipestifer]|uniref:hypothetical protein n=1 Tax=Riemerella anatipestifer TaxID=34085 RepID=UPI000D144D64|nr:hypothetical protein [Riemerella anatipestifer]PST45063.1 hypothetical protein CYV15_00715 [Riemerella anatipestifer]
MKKVYLLVASLSMGMALSQTGNVGINTENPNATLDVVGAPTNAQSLDGIIAPRLTGEQLRAKTYTSNQTGALVYVTLADPNPAGQTIDVTASGYYYFDGAASVNKWVRVVNPGSSPVDWHVDGNNGTVAGKNFVGTRDDVALMFKVNMVNSGFISQFKDNTTTPSGANVSLGYESLPLVPTVPATSPATGAIRQNVALGWQALGTTTVTGPLIQNIAVGDRTLKSLQQGGTNIAIGNKAMQNATTGNSNIAIGVNALHSLSATDNWGNIALGYRVAENMTGGRDNVFLKNFTAINNQGDNFKSGNNNVFIGKDSGYGVLTANNNIAIGAASSLLDAKDGQINIGNVIFGSGAGSGVVQVEKKVGIATSKETPATETFHVNGTARITDLPLNGATSAINTKTDGTASTAKDQTFTAVKTVVVDANGVLGTVSGLPTVEDSSNTLVNRSYEKCTKGPIGDAVNNVSQVITFYDYEFRYRDAALGVGNIEVRKSTLPSRWAKNEKIGGTTLYSAGNFDVTQNWTNIMSVAFQTSYSGTGQFIVEVTGQAFEYRVLTLNANGNKVYTFCAKMLSN